jgi:hypothetical protein
MTPFLPLPPLCVVGLLLALAACSGAADRTALLPSQPQSANVVAGAGGDSDTDTDDGPQTPDVPSKITITKRKLIFAGVFTTATVTANETGYRGAFHAKSSDVHIAKVRPLVARGGAVKFTVVPVAGGAATIDIKDAKGNVAHVKVFVSALTLVLQNVPAAATSVTYTAQSTRSTNFVAGNVRLDAASRNCTTAAGKRTCTIAVLPSVGKKAGAPKLVNTILLNFLDASNNQIAGMRFFAYVRHFARQAVNVPVATWTGYLRLPASATGSLTAGPVGDSRLWYVDATSGTVDAATTAGVVSQYTQPQLTGGFSNAFSSITPGAAGTLWFAAQYYNFTVEPNSFVNAVSTSGTFAQHATTPSSCTASQPQNYEPLSVAYGPDANVWFIEATQNAACQSNESIGIMSPSGAVLKNYALATDSGGNGLYMPQPGQHQIIAGADGALWFWLSPCAQSATCTLPSAIGRITTSGSISYYTLPVVTGCSNGFLAKGGDGNVWFATPCVPAGAQNAHTTIGRITAAGAMTLFYGQKVWAMDYPALDLAEGPDGNLYMPAQGQFGRFVTAGTNVGQIDEYSIPVGKGGAYLNSMATGPNGVLYALDCGVCANRGPSYLEPIGLP